MRFRLGRREDLAGCHRILVADEGLRAKEEIWSALPETWADLLGNALLASFAIFEDDDTQQGSDRVELCGFAMSTFATDDFAREIRERPEPHIAARVYERYVRGEHVLLNPDEVRLANTESRLHLLILHACHRHHDLSHPETRRLMPVGAHSFHFGHAGYRLLSITGEVYGSDKVSFMQHGGYAVLADFADHAEASQAARRPYLVGLDRDQVSRGATNPMSLEMFHPEAPVFHFTPAEQRILTHALMGVSDRQVAAELDLSTETVRSTWDSIYTRVGRARPRLLTNAEVEPSTVARGAEKRRHLLDYLRQHMEELRPMQRPR
jgi:hypothetical protein